MTTAFPERIRMVRQSLGPNFEIVAVQGSGVPVGVGLDVGANLEVVPGSVWTKKNASRLLSQR